MWGVILLSPTVECSNISKNKVQEKDKSKMKEKKGHGKLLLK